jgi:uncharacterized protein (TIGR02996 family)
VSDEEAFQTALDAHPDDHHTRLVFADWLQERGDPRAEGYRALGLLRVAPYDEESGKGWKGYGRTNNADNPLAAPGGRASGALLPPDWFALAGEGNQYPNWNPHAWAYWRSRRGAEDTAALAFAKLPPNRRAELLAAPPAEGKPAPPTSRSRARKKSAAKKPKRKK